MDQLKFPWQESVLEAFMASPDFLGAKIAVAQRAISARLTGSDGVDPEEHLALQDAIRALGVLLKETRARTSPAHQRKQEDIA